MPSNLSCLSSSTTRSNELKVQLNSGEGVGPNSEPVKTLVGFDLGFQRRLLFRITASSDSQRAVRTGHLFQNFWSSDDGFKWPTTKLQWIIVILVWLIARRIAEITNMESLVDFVFPCIDRSNVRDAASITLF